MANQFTAFACDIGAARALIGDGWGCLPEGWKMPWVPWLPRVQDEIGVLGHAESSAHPGPPCHTFPALPKAQESPPGAVLRLMPSLCAELAFSQLCQTLGFVLHPPPFPQSPFGCLKTEMLETEFMLQGEAVEIRVCVCV